MVSEWALDPDAALMVKVCGGHEPSFETLLARHRSQVVNHLYRLVRNRAIAEELAQDVFLRVYRFRNRYQPEAKFSTWLFRITTNVALNWRRDTRRETAHLRLDAALHDARRIQVPDQPCAPTSSCWPSITPRKFATPSKACPANNSPRF